MIQRLSHATIWVDDQDAAREFYVDKLGFEVRTDVKMGDFRWLTVGPKAQKDLQIVLMALRPGPMMDEATVAALRALVTTGKLGGGVFDTDDCRRSFEELSARGVRFLSEPEERPYGIEAVFSDNTGNWFSLTQRRR
jgi:catechol 2,3-dioxygenase-like lactoylglutathione lyase family enzyme